MTPEAAATATPPAPATVKTGRKHRSLAGQGLIMSAGFATAQALSFARNATLGYLLSKGDFGVAATLTITLQVFELLTDVAADRLILQARDGDNRLFIGVAHTIMIARGALIGLLMFLLAPLIAAYFRIPELAWAFQWMAALPVIKGFINLDARRQQRHLNNLPMIWIEVVPQAVALLAIWPAVALTGSFEAILYAATAQAIAMVALSQAIAKRRYQIRFNGTIVRRFISFAWPILLSALPLFAVYQGERLMVARLFDLEHLASFSVAFLITMIPSVVATKIAIALGLPLISKELQQHGPPNNRTTNLLANALLGFAMLYVVGFVMLGGEIVALAFGPQYQGLDALVAAFACMWAVRMIQITAGAALMAHTDTKPLLTCGIIRAAALLPALHLALNGAPLVMIVWAGFVGECMSCIYAFYHLSRAHQHRVHGLVAQLSALMVVTVFTFGLKAHVPMDAGFQVKLTLTALNMGAAVLLLLGMFPELRKLLLTRTLVGQPAEPARS